MTLHQVNGDGAGPYECMIDSTGAGTQWTAMTVVTNVPGEDSRSDAKATDFVSRLLLNLSSLSSVMMIGMYKLTPPKPLTAKVAATQTCTGSMAGMDGVCMVRCNNAARAGPFGGCVPVQMASAAGNATAAAKMRRGFRA